jgi:methylmalonyl-CoA carboxyltransferase large subunit
MSSGKADLQPVLTAVDALREEVSRLGGRVAALESALAEVKGAAAAADESINEELVMTISAAIAAYLGVKPRIRQIRLLGNASWAQTGRITIQASHAIAPHHG